MCNRISSLDVDQTLTVEITLAVGAATETVRGDRQLRRRSIRRTRYWAGPSRQDEIIGLPLVNRNIYTQVSLTPGVMANNNSPTANPTGNPTFATGLYIQDVQINGSIDGGSAEVAFYLDGGNNITGMRNYGNPSPNPDAVEEFRVETSAFGAQYGQFSAAVVSVITKSGTNQWHGGLFEFNRNTDFNANTWAPAHNAAGQIIVSPYHRNQFGGDVGGPIKKDKAFFFFSYGGLRQVTSTVFTGAHHAHGRRAPGRLYRRTPSRFTRRAQPTSPRTRWTERTPAPIAKLPQLNCIPQALLDTTISNIDNVSNKIGSSIPLPNRRSQSGKGRRGILGSFHHPD